MSAKRPFFFITPWYGTFAGGGERAIGSIAEAVQKCGYEATVLTTCSRSPYADWRTHSYEPGGYEVNGVRVVRFRVDQTEQNLYHAAVATKSRGETVSSDLQDAFFRFGLNSQDLIHFVGHLPTDAVVIAGTYFQSLIPSVVNAHPGRVIALPAFHDEPEFYWEPVREMVLNSRGYLFLSEEEKELAVRTYGRTVGRRLVESPVVGLGVELKTRSEQHLNDEQFSRQIRARLKLPAQYFVYVGRIEHGKGLSYLVPWFLRWNECRTALGQEPVALVLVGEGPGHTIPDSPWLKRVGYLAEDEKLVVMQRSVALINPSLMESFSYVVMEAWLAGAPVLVPGDCAVTAGHTNRSGGGLSFRDEVDFGLHLDRLLEAGVREALVARGREYVNERYRWPDVIDRILRVVLQ